MHESNAAAAKLVVTSANAPLAGEPAARRDRPRGGAVRKPVKSGGDGKHRAAAHRTTDQTETSDHQRPARGFGNRGILQEEQLAAFDKIVAAQILSLIHI